jgi:hypothetical protein
LAFKIDQHWQADLIDMKRYKNVNSHYQYILCCIDVLSKFVFVEAIKNKTAHECAVAFEKIFKKGRVPQYLYMDLGNEFKGESRAVFKKYNITYLDTKSIHKASVVERFNRTFKEKISRLFTENGNFKYVGELQQLALSYNNTVHSVIKMPPAKVNLATETKARENIYGKDDLLVENDYLVHFEFKIGDYVRVALRKSLFEKGYTANWSNDIFVIYYLNPSNPPTYKIQSLQGEQDDLAYYKQELQLVPTQDFPYDSFEILDTNKNQVLIKKLNSENQQEKWVKRVQPSRAVKK